MTITSNSNIHVIMN